MSNSLTGEIAAESWVILFSTHPGDPTLLAIAKPGNQAEGMEILSVAHAQNH